MNKLLLISLVALLMISMASAFSTNTFSNNLTIENLSFNYDIISSDNNVIDNNYTSYGTGNIYVNFSRTSSDAGGSNLTFTFMPMVDTSSIVYCRNITSNSWYNLGYITGSVNIIQNGSKVLPISCLLNPTIEIYFHMDIFGGSIERLYETTLNSSFRFNAIRYLSIPQNNLLVKAYLNLSSYPLITNLIGEVPDTNTNEKGARGEKINITKDGIYIVNVIKQSAHNATYAYIKESNTFQILATAPFVGDTATFNYLTNKSQTYIIVSNRTDEWVNMRYKNAVVGYPNVSNDFNWIIGVYNNYVDDATTYNNFVSITTSQGVLPTNSSLAIGSTQVWNYLGAFNQTNNRTLNLASYINSYLGTCSYDSGYCQVPFVFHSDTFGILKYSDLQFDNNGVIENSHSFNASAVETTNQGYVLNTTIDTSYWIAQSAILYFNGTTYPTIKSSDGYNTLFTSNVNLPAVSSEASKDVLWQIQLTNSTGSFYFNTSTYSQTISKIGFVKCGGTSNVTFVNFTVYSQTEPSNRINTPFYATFHYWVGDGSIKSTYTYQETGAANSSFPFCFEPNSSSLNIDADIQYGNAGGYSQNYFYYRNKQLTSSPTNQTLYLLNSSLTTITTLRAIDSYQNGLVGYIGKIYLHNDGTNTDNLVGMFKTNYNGQDIAYLNWYDSLYKFELYDPTISNLVYTAEPFKVSSTPQTFRISTISNAINWIYFQDVAYTLTTNNDTRTILLTYNDPNNHITAGCLRVIKYWNGNASIISDQCLNSTSGTLIYTVADGEYGDYYGVFYGKGSIGTIAIAILSLPDYTQEIYHLLGNLDATVMAIFVIALSAFAGIAFGVVGFIMMAMVGYILSAFLGFQMTASYQIAFFSFLAVGGYLMWKLRT